MLEACLSITFNLLRPKLIPIDNLFLVKVDERCNSNFARYILNSSPISFNNNLPSCSNYEASSQLFCMIASFISYIRGVELLPRVFIILVWWMYKATSISKLSFSTAMRQNNRHFAILYRVLQEGWAKDHGWQ